MKNCNRDAGKLWGRGAGNSSVSITDLELLKEEEGGGSNKGTYIGSALLPVPRPRSDEDAPLHPEAKRVVAMDRADPFRTTASLYRFLARSWPASMLHPAVRRAAARDPALEWNEARRSYGYRRVTPPAPPAATSGSVEPQGEAT